jgi:hypothetical protein
MGELRKTEVQVEIARIAATIDLTRVEIPVELQGMDSMDAIHHRLQMHVQQLGGYEALARACPRTRAKIWQSKIERNGRFKLSVEDFRKLIRVFDDMVLVALLADGHDHYLVDLRAIPPSEYSTADLAWALRRYGAMGTLLASDWREAMLDGADCKDIKADLLQLMHETLITLRQMTLALD